MVLMKNYDRIYGILMVLIVGVFIFFEISSLSLSFQMSLAREKEINETANLRFAIMLKNTIDMLDDSSTVNDEELIGYLCDGIYRGMENHTVIYLAFDDEKKLYESRLSVNKAGDVSVYSSIEDLYTEYFSIGDRRYMQITNRIDYLDKPVYIRTVLDISDIYVERDQLLGRYRLIVIAVFIFLGLGLYFFTRIFEKNIRLSEKMNQLEAASKQQEEFSASFAHECKTPLTSIIGYSDMLRSMDLTEHEQKESAEVIFEQGKRLERLAQQMMVLSNLREGEITNQPVDVTTLIQNALIPVSAQMQKKNIQVTVSIESGTMRGERDLYHSLMTNILDNARKACETNGEINLTGKSRGAFYELTVADNGCGMSPETVKKMTEPFYMADKARTRREGGAGLGMSIVGKIVTVFNIRLDVQSTLGEGTTIQLLIPTSQEV
jgi:signal transduction histidine kinase